MYIPEDEVEEVIAALSGQVCLTTNNRRISHAAEGVMTAHPLVNKQIPTGRQTDTTHGKANSISMLMRQTAASFVLDFSFSILVHSFLLLTRLFRSLALSSVPCLLLLLLFSFDLTLTILSIGCARA